MFDAVVLVVLLLGVATIAAYWRNARIRELSRERMERLAVDPGAAAADRPPAARAFLVRRRWIPWAAGLALGVLLYFVFHWSMPFVAAVTFLVVLLGGRLEAFLAAARTAKIEAQLAAAIDLMVAALRAGAGVAESLDYATSEAQAPLRPQLREVVGRIRLGDDPKVVYHGLTKRVPLETFLLFASALTVQAETGGSLAPTLASVGRTIRDRIEISRRIRSNSAQSEASTVAVLAVTYFIALIVWRAEPGQMQDFLATQVGQWAVAGTIFLQAFGVVWMSAVSRMRF